MISIAHPLWVSLQSQPFDGQLHSCFTRACNAVSPDGRLVTLSHTSLGNGPFSIVLDDPLAFFAQRQPQQPLTITSEVIMIAGQQIPLTSAHIWQPRLAPLTQAISQFSPLHTRLQPYRSWPVLADNSAYTTQMAVRLRQAADGYLEALVKSQESRVKSQESTFNFQLSTINNELLIAVRRLAGLGSGLTPAGDDYLLGSMLALYLLDKQELLPIIAQAAVPYTNRLSAAFLHAAGYGEFIEPWHNLVWAIEGADWSGCVARLDQIAGLGASSGRDALAGFAEMLYTLLHNAL